MISTQGTKKISGQVLPVAEPALASGIDHTLPHQIDPPRIPHTLNNLRPIRRFPAPLLATREQPPVLQ